MKRGPIPGVNIATNTASRGYPSGETGVFAQMERTLDIAPNTLPQDFARMGLLPSTHCPTAACRLVVGCLPIPSSLSIFICFFLLYFWVHCFHILLPLILGMSPDSILIASRNRTPRGSGQRRKEMQ